MTLHKINLEDVKDDMLNWYASIKYDGVRCYWNGTNLYTRGKKKIRAPLWFTSQLPSNVPLDGELFMDGNFEVLNGLVKIKDNLKFHKRQEDWKDVQYMVFDTLHPNFVDQPYKKRYKLIKAVYKKSRQMNNAYNWEIVKQVPLKQSRGKLNEFYEARLKEGHEGVVIRNPNAEYESRRSHDILKIKPTYDAEAKIIGYVEGKRNNAGRLGSFLVVGYNGEHKGKEFKLSGQITDDVRNAYSFKPNGKVSVSRGFPRVGSIVNYQYMTTTSHGKPRQPIYVRQIR